MAADKEFVVLKFVDGNDDDDIAYEVGLSQWLLRVDKDMRASTYWPPKETLVGNYVRNEVSADKAKWPVYTAEVKRYYDTYLNARNAMKGFLAESSAYESEKELGRGKRRRKTPCIESDSESDEDARQATKKKKKAAPPPTPEINTESYAIPKGAALSRARKIVIKSALKKSLSKTGVGKTLLDKVREKKKSSVEKINERLQQTREKLVDKKEMFKKSKVATEPVTTPSKISDGGNTEEHDLNKYVKSPTARLTPRSSTLPAMKSPRQHSKIKFIASSPSQLNPQPSKSTAAALPVGFKSFGRRMSDSQFEGRGTLSKSPRQLSGDNLAKSLDSRKGASPSPVASSSHQFLHGNFTPPLSQRDHNPSSRDTVEYIPSPISSKDIVNCSPASRLKRMSPIMGKPEDLCKRALFTASPLKHLSSSNVASDIFQLLKKNSTKLDSVDKLSRKVDSLQQTVDVLSSKIDVTLMNQGKLNRSLLPREKKIVRPSNLPSLPLKTLEELKTFETFLENDFNLTATCDYLDSFSIPSNEGSAVTFLMTKLMTNSLASEFNFDGLGNKIGFKDLNTWRVLQGSLSNKFKDSSLEQALKSLRSWLVNAPWRKSDKAGADRRKAYTKKMTHHHSATAEEEEGLYD